MVIFIIIIIITLMCDKSSLTNINPSGENMHKAHINSYTCSFTVVLLHTNTAKITKHFMLLVKLSRITHKKPNYRSAEYTRGYVRLYYFAFFIFSYWKYQESLSQTTIITFSKHVYLFQVILSTLKFTRSILILINHKPYSKRVYIQKQSVLSILF